MIKHKIKKKQNKWKCKNAIIALNDENDWKGRQNIYIMTLKINISKDPGHMAFYKM